MCVYFKLQAYVCLGAMTMKSKKLKFDLNIIQSQNFHRAISLETKTSRGQIGREISYYEKFLLTIPAISFVLQGDTINTLRT